MDADVPECHDMYLAMEAKEKKKKIDRNWYQSMAPERKNAYRAHRNMVKKINRMKSRLALMNPTEKEYGLRKGLLLLAQEDATKAAIEWGLAKVNNNRQARLTNKGTKKDIPTIEVSVSTCWRCPECTKTNQHHDSVCQRCLLPC
jgi:hypothetical protein